MTAATTLSPDTPRHLLASQVVSRRGARAFLTPAAAMSLASALRW